MGMVAYFIEIPVGRFDSVDPGNFLPANNDEDQQFEIISKKESKFKKLLNKLGLAKPDSDFEVRINPTKHKHPYDHLIDEAFSQQTFPMVDVDKAWDGLHRCLNGGLQEPLRGTIAAKAVMGDNEYSSEVAMGVQTLSANSVKEVALSLEKLSLNDIESSFQKLGDDVYAFNGDTEDLAYTIDAYNTAKSFYTEAAKNNSAVLIAIS